MGPVTARRVTYTAARALAVDTLAPTTIAPPPAVHVSIDVAYTGVRGTDLHIFHGAMDARIHPPGAIGHEMSGRVADTAPDVVQWEAGTPVTVTPFVACGQCPACRAGHRHICITWSFSGSTPPDRCRRAGPCRPTHWSGSPRHARWSTPRRPNPPRWPSTTCGARNCAPAKRLWSSAADRSACWSPSPPAAPEPTFWWWNPTRTAGASPKPWGRRPSTPPLSMP
ncbi:alcohol dehydrogenase catalytic domain-containing protein [Streptomyces shenzhenensis]|uniref:alcohol dehydrogenase catalytic domain-containing protein n=1 Tax=Streptomyces shenzhenensis TaxID=943815 RepID=UPI001F1B422A|nr:alcohol dehydrogenase catalytic domain-containing protein [Streptomyces shenzhenensis]